MNGDSDNQLNIERPQVHVASRKAQSRRRECNIIPTHAMTVLFEDKYVSAARFVLLMQHKTLHKLGQS